MQNNYVIVKYLVYVKSIYSSSNTLVYQDFSIVEKRYIERDIYDIYWTHRYERVRFDKSIERAQSFAILAERAV